MTHVLIYEASAGGHFLAYVRHLVQELHRRGKTPLVVLPRDVADSPEFASALAPHLQAGETLIVDDALTMAKILALGQDVGAEHVVVPNGDAFAYKLWRPSRQAFEPMITLLILAPPEHEPPSLKNLLKRVLLHRLERSANIRIRRLTNAGVPAPRGATPDPVSVSCIDNDWDGGAKVDEWAQGRRIFLLVGVIQPWKNPSLVIRSFRAARLEGSCLVIAGPQPPHVARLIEELVPIGDPSILCVDQLLTDAQINHLVSVSYAVVLAYSTHAPNSTAAKALALGTRIVAAGSPDFLRNIREVGASPAMGTLDEDSLTRAIRASTIAMPVLKTRLADAKDFASSLLD